MTVLKYLGTANSYTRGSYRFPRENGRLCDVREEDVKGFLLEVPNNTLSNGNPAFMVYEGRNFLSKEDQTKLRRYRVGDFHNKADALEYAKNEFGVLLNESLSLGELNQQSLELHKRGAAPVMSTPAEIIKGLRGASLLDEDSGVTLVKAELDEIDTGHEDAPVVKRPRGRPKGYKVVTTAPVREQKAVVEV